MNEITNRPLGRFLFLCIALLLARLLAYSTPPGLTTITDAVYLANGQPASGTILVTWPAFNTRDNKTVAAGELSVTIGAGGGVSFQLAPNEGASPDGTYYKAVYKLSDGTTATEYWVVPVASPATITAIRATVVPRQVGAQLASRAYVDTAITTNSAELVHKAGSESITGAKAFAVSPTVPAPTSAAQAANREYVDGQMSMQTALIAQKLNRAGDTPVTLAALRFADQFAGAGTGQKIDAACADLGGSSGVVIVPSSAAAGDSTIGVPDNCRVIDFRTGAGPNEYGSEGMAFSKGIMFRSRYTAAPNAVANYSTLHIYSEPASGGYNTTGGPKTTYSGLNVRMASRTQGQKLNVQSLQNCFGQGDCQAMTAVATAYGHMNAGGDEGTVSFRGAVQQGSDIARFTVASVSGTTINYNSGTATSTMGELRPVIITTPAKIYSTGTITSIAGTPPTVTCSGCNFLSLGAAGPVSNLFFSLDAEGQAFPVLSITRASNVLTVTTADAHGLAVSDVAGLASNLDSSFDGTCTVATVPTATTFTCAQTGADVTTYGGVVTSGKNFRVVVPVRSITDATHLVLDYKLTNTDAAWPTKNSVQSGAYKIYKGGIAQTIGYPQAATGSLTISPATDFAATDTAEMPLGYAHHLTGVFQTVKQHLNAPVSGGTVTAANIGTRPLGAAFSTTGNFQRVLWQSSGVVQNNAIEIQGKVNGALVAYSNNSDVNQTIALDEVTSKTGAARRLSFCRSCGTDGQFQLDASTVSIDKNIGGVGINVNAQSNTGLYVHVNGASVSPLILNNNNGSPTAMQFAVNAQGIPRLYVQNNNTYINNGYSLVGQSGNQASQTWSVNSATGAANFKTIITAVNTVTFSATPTFDAALGNTQKLTLTENVTSSTLSGATAGQALHFILCQDATGSRTFSWPANVKGGMAIGSNASTCSAQTFIYDGTNAYATGAGVVNQ